MKHAFTLLLIVVCCTYLFAQNDFPVPSVFLGKDLPLEKIKTKKTYTTSNKNDSFAYTLDSSYTWAWALTKKVWVVTDKNIFTYNANRSKTNELGQQIDYTTNTFVNSYQYLYTYDANNNLASTVQQNWKKLSMYGRIFLV